MYEKSGDGNSILQVQVRAVIFVGHISLEKFLQGFFSPKCICLAHLIAQQILPGASQMYVVGAGTSSVCHSERAAVLALLCWQARVYSLPFQPLGLLVTSPGCHSAAPAVSQAAQP